MHNPPAPHMTEEAQSRTRHTLGAIAITLSIFIVAYVWATDGLPLWLPIGVTLVSIGVTVNVTRSCQRK